MHLESKLNPELLLRKHQGNANEHDNVRTSRAVNLVEADPTGRNTYLKACENLRVVPVSYFLRNITAPEIVMRHHGVGPQEARAMSRVLRVSTGRAAPCVRDEVGDPRVHSGSRSHEEGVLLQDTVTLERLDLNGNCVTGLGALYMARMLIDNDYISELVCRVC